MCIHDRNVRSLAKNTLGSTFAASAMTSAASRKCGEAGRRLAVHDCGLAAGLPRCRGAGGARDERDAGADAKKMLQGSVQGSSAAATTRGLFFFSLGMQSNEGRARVRILKELLQTANTPGWTRG